MVWCLLFSGLWNWSYRFTEDEALQQDFNAYLASSTDEEEDQEGGREEDAQDGAKVAVTEEEQIQKYRVRRGLEVGGRWEGYGVRWEVGGVWSEMGG